MKNRKETTYGSYGWLSDSADGCCKVVTEPWERTYGPFKTSGMIEESTVDWKTGGLAVLNLRLTKLDGSHSPSIYDHGHDQDSCGLFS